MSNFKKWLLAGAAGAALLCGLSFLSGETPQPPSSPLKTAFNKAAATGLRLVGDETTDRRLVNILGIAASSPTCQKMLGRNNLSGWRIGMQNMSKPADMPWLEWMRHLPDAISRRLFHVGETYHGYRAILLNPGFSDSLLAATFIHELAHIEQKRLGLRLGSYPARDGILAVKLREASSFALETQAAWELKDQIPGIWESHRSFYPDFSAAWEKSVAENPENATNGVALVRTFDSFFSSSLSTSYEKTQASHERQTLPEDIADMPKAETIASLSLHGISGFAQHLPGFDLANPRYIGVHAETLSSLRAAGIAENCLPPLRSDAPSPPATKDDGANCIRLAVIVGFILGSAPVAWQLGRLGHACYKYRRALALRDSLNPKPR